MARGLKDNEVFSPGWVGQQQARGYFLAKSVQLTKLEDGDSSRLVLLWVRNHIWF